MKGTHVGHVREVALYPVKSMAGLLGLDDSTGEPSPTHVRTPAGAELPLRSVELQRDVAERFGGGVELMKFKHGIFDDGSVSVISLVTMAGISDAAGIPPDTRRFRANIVIETPAGESWDIKPFQEDGWVGGRLVFGDSESGPAVSVTTRDERCVMINLDPDTGQQDARMLKAVVRLNDNHAGVYGTVTQTGTIHVGQAVRLVV